MSDRTGSGAHLNVSLHDFESETNAFKDLSDPNGLGLSKLAYHFCGALSLSRYCVTVIIPQLAFWPICRLSLP